MRTIQITIDEALLAALEEDEQVKKEGRSSVIRMVLREWLKRRTEEMIRDAYRRAYSEQPVAADEFFVDQEGTAWPEP